MIVLVGSFGGFVRLVLGLLWMGKKMEGEVEMEGGEKEEGEEMKEMKMGLLMKIWDEVGRGVRLMVGGVEEVMSKMKEGWRGKEVE